MTAVSARRFCPPVPCQEGNGEALAAFAHMFPWNSFEIYRLLLACLSSQLLFLYASEHIVSLVCETLRLLPYKASEWALFLFLFPSQ